MTPAADLHKHSAVSRTQAAAQARDESDRGDMEQHAHKLIRGFEKLNDVAARKAVWELVQNACDLREGNECHVTVDFRNSTFAFSHNGKAFTTHTLLSLIKQVSGGKRRVLVQTEERGPVGQFGTGFITTHAFGRRFHIDSALNVGLADAPPEYVLLDGFTIDRRAHDLDKLTDELLGQHKQVFALVETGEQVAVVSPTTTFRYVPESDTEAGHVETAYRGLLRYMPLVMALNEPLTKATIIAADGQEKQYEKGEWTLAGGVWQMPVYCNDEVSVIQCLRSPNADTWVVLPLNAAGGAEAFAADVARLYMYFPLVGTEAWGCEFLMHSRRFAPLEPRDGLHLELGNPQTQAYSEQNRAVLLDASELVFAFVEQEAERIANPMRLARVHFGLWPADEATEQAVFATSLQRQWVEKFRTLPLVETARGRKSSEVCWFLRPELLQGEDESMVAAMHAVVAHLWENQVPVLELAVAWTGTVHEWQDDTTQWIGPELLAQKLQEQGELGQLDPAALRQVYDYLLAYDQAKLFDHYRLLPTVAGEFKTRDCVKRPLNLVPQLVDVLRSIVPDIAASFVHPCFADMDLALDPYGRSQLGRDVNERTRKLLEDGPATVADDVRHGLRLLNSIYSAEVSASAAPSIRRRLMPSVFEFYEVDYAECIVPNVADDELEYERTPFRTLVRVFLADFEKKYRAEKDWAATDALPLLQKCMEVLAPSDQLRELLAATPAFPNQNGRLCLPGNLVVEKEFAPIGSETQKLKDWYQKVMGAEIQEELVDAAFIDCLQYFKPKDLTGKTVAVNLEKELMGMELIEKITVHPKADEIVDIIRAMGSNKGWESYFTNINAQKANIMLAKISDDKVKDDLFGIIGLQPGEIAQLGTMVRDGNLSEIIRRGQESLRAEAEETWDLAYKKRVGEGIEDLVRARLQTEVAGLPVTVEPRQGGQDMEVMLGGKVVYRIEVKARWSATYFATLSNLQALTASANSERYALCSVDLVSYRPEGEERERYEVDDVTKIEDRIRFVADIGTQVEALIANVRAAKGRQDRVQLAEDFQVAVPEQVTEQGVSFGEFVQYLHDLLEQIAIDALSLNK